MARVVNTVGTAIKAACIWLTIFSDRFSDDAMMNLGGSERLGSMVKSWEV